MREIYIKQSQFTLGGSSKSHKEVNITGQRTIAMQTMEAQNMGRWVCVDCGGHTVMTIYEATGGINRCCVDCEKEVINEKGKLIEKLNRYED